MDVYGMNLSAPCRIVTMTAECLGVEYNFKILDLMAGEHMKPEFLAINPMHNIPTMVDGDFVLNESRAIAAYLVNKHGKDDKLYPKDAETRARVDQRLYFDMGVFYKVNIVKYTNDLQDWIFNGLLYSTFILQAFGECVYPVMFGGDKPGQEKFDKVKEVLGWVDGFVKDGKFSAGNDEMTIGDLALLATYSTMKAAELPEIDLAEYSNLEAWYEKCVKLVPNYEKANGEGAAAFGGFFKSKASA